MAVPASVVCFELVDSPFHMTGTAGNPAVGIVDELFSVGRMALTAVNMCNLFMVFFSHLGMAFQTLNIFVDRCCMVNRHFFMAVLALS